ncbi:MAG: CDC48 family AAA ATPase [Nanoarchaeota archaeon]
MTVKLKVAEAIQDDVNKGIVRIDSSFMRQINIRPGNIVEIVGERTTVAIADRALPGDIGLNIIRMDGLIRRNAKTSIGEIIEIRKANIKEAKRVVIAPARKGIMIRGNPAIFKQGLLGRAVVKNDIVSLGGSKRRRTTLSDPFFEDMFGMPDDTMMGFGLGDLKFVIVDVMPKQAVLITENTQVQFNPEAVELKEEKSIDISYEDIGGLDEELQKIREMVELPLKHPELFERLGIEPPKGVLLHGSPGTGKTLLAKAVANETNSNFILINGPEIMSKYYGQSEENLRKKFEDAEKNAPSIIFIDEIDAIASKREESKGEVERRVVAQLLAIMDGLKSRGKVVVIAATNIPNSLEPALRRPGRFDREIEIGVPRKEGRLDILKIHTRNMPLERDAGSLDTNLDDAKLKKALKTHLDAVVVDDLFATIKSLDSTRADSASMARERRERFEKYLNSLLKKGNRPVDQFMRSCFRRIAEDFATTVPRDASADEARLALSEKLEDIRKEEVLSSLVSDTVRLLLLDELASITHGFVGADLSALAKEAAMIVLRRVLPEIKMAEERRGEVATDPESPPQEDELPAHIVEKLKISKSDFFEALKVVRPSALREFLIEVPTVKWGDIGGLSDVKQELKEAVEWPLKQPQVFKRMGIRPPRGVLLYGPPGTGKTLLAKAVANESQANFITVKGPELLSKWVGESEKAVRKIFEKARQSSPAIIFFDEVDSLAPRRGMNSGSHVTETVVNQLLTEMDGLQDMTDIVIIAATNRPDILDPALLRPGRFDRIILAPVPDTESRRQIFEVHTKGMPLDKDIELARLVEMTQGYVGADIEAVCREAAIIALRRNIDVKTVSFADFDAAVKKVPPSVTKDIEDSYKEMESQFRSAQAKQMANEKPNYYG